MLLTGVTVTSLLVASVTWLLSSSGTNYFVPEACANVMSLLPSHVVGQDLAINVLTDAVCEHLTSNRRKPLIISVHGPPGVGKTYTHTLLARALYNRNPLTAIDCPGKHCTGAKVMYGMDYLEVERQSQLSAIRSAILEHFRFVANPVLVVEEYDKLSCESRGLLRQILQRPELSNSTVNKPIVLLESNLGFLELEEMVDKVRGNKSLITSDAADSYLRSLVMTAWRKNPCESFEDSLAFGATVDFFLPFFPLTRPEVWRLVEMELESSYGSRLMQYGAILRADAAAVTWLVNRIDFAGGNYPIEGAKQVTSICVKHVWRLVYNLALELQAAGRKKQSSTETSSHPVLEYELRVAPDERELQLVKLGKELESIQENDDHDMVE